LSQNRVQCVYTQNELACTKCVHMLHLRCNYQKVGTIRN
jgi:hypothetical protein